MIALPLLLLGCAGWYDPEDCRTRGDQAEECAPYVPRGLVCGLIHGSGLGGGALCDGRNPAAIPPPGTSLREVCPSWFERAGIADVSTPIDQPLGQGFTANDRLFCASYGNLGGSSADLAEVHEHAACGLSSTGKGYTYNTCLGIDPLADGCPDGFTRRFAVDRPNASERSHLVVWCELDDGCVADECGEALDLVDVVCGLQGTSVPESSEALLAELDVPNLDAELLDWVAQEVDSAPAPPTCWGGSPLDDTCPTGFETACIGDRYGDGGVAIDTEALCWCAPSRAVVEPETTEEGITRRSAPASRPGSAAR